MSVLGDVFHSLTAMNQQQLLTAFIGCISYAAAQGAMLPGRGRSAASLVAIGAALCFAIESAEWTYAAMLIAFAVAGLGGFVAAVWLASRALGVDRMAGESGMTPIVADAFPEQTPARRPIPGRTPSPAHST